MYQNYTPRCENFPSFGSFILFWRLPLLIIPGIWCITDSDILFCLLHLIIYKWQHFQGSPPEGRASPSELLSEWASHPSPIGCGKSHDIRIIETLCSDYSCPIAHFWKGQIHQQGPPRWKKDILQKWNKYICNFPQHN